jgi:hypothetical protein
MSRRPNSPRRGPARPGSEANPSGIRLIRANVRARACALVSFVILSVTTGLALAPSPAFALPEGRVYEMVSPPYKGGYGVGGLGGLIKAVAPDGESVAFYSKGAFAGAPSGFTGIDYVSRRGVSGWSTSASMPPAVLLGSLAAEDVSSSLGSIVAVGKPGPTREAASRVGTEAELWLHDTSTPDLVSNWELAGMPLKPLDGTNAGVGYDGASADLCRLFLNTSIGGSPLLPEAVGVYNIYELDRGCNGEPQSLRLVGVKNSPGPNGEPELIAHSCLPAFGTEHQGGGGKASRFNAISADGREVFFTTGVTEKGGFCGADDQLFVRLDGERTLEIAKPVSEAGVCGEAIPCPGAATRANGEFVGASRDGSLVFFSTTAPLVGEDKDGMNDLYMARIGCREGNPGCGVAEREVTSLVLVSHDLTVGEAAELQGVVRVAPDGSRVYFVARGVLGEGPNAEGQAPVKGADNLYVYDSVSGKTVFVTDGIVNEAQTAGSDGRFLVFSSYGQLTGDDTDSAKDVYRYDAETGVLNRVSVGEAGNDANGNNSVFDAKITEGNQGGHVNDQYEMYNRAISEDGSRIVFASSEPLSPDAINHLENIYEWHMQPGSSEGRVSLISSGSASESEGARAGSVVISPSGRDVFFTTAQGLLRQDTDGLVDVYDARLGGGFPPAPSERRPCEGDACQGPLTNPAPLLVPGSVLQAPGENFAPPVTAVTPKKATPRCSKGRKLSHGKCVKGRGKAKKSSRRSGR